MDYPPCEICQTNAGGIGTKRCDRCWELETRIKRDPELASKILASLTPTSPDVFVLSGRGLNEMLKRVTLEQFLKAHPEIKQ